MNCSTAAATMTATSNFHQLYFGKLFKTYLPLATFPSALDTIWRVTGVRECVCVGEAAQPQLICRPAPVSWGEDGDWAAHASHPTQPTVSQPSRRWLITHSHRGHRRTGILTHKMIDMWKFPKTYVVFREDFSCACSFCNALKPSIF